VTSTQNGGEKVDERKLGNWITAFRDWAIPRTDAPESFVFWAAIYAIAAALRRQVWIPKRHLGSWECSPHLYLMFVGPPGMRKTTSMMSFAHPLLQQVGGLTDGPTFFTKELLTQRLIQSPDSSIYLMVGEFAELVQKNKPGEMYDFLTSMYDSRDSLEVGTMMRGVEKANRPCLNMFAATTPAWIAENMTAGVIGGGFASRIIFVYEEKLRNPKLIFTELMDQFGEDDRSADLLHDLTIISELAGEFDFGEGMEKKLNEWIIHHSESPPSDIRLMGYHSRKPMMMLKLAMIYSVATKNELVIDEDAIEFGKFALKTTEMNLSKVFGGIGRNEFIFDMDAIIGYVMQEGKVSHDQILSQFRSVAHPSKLQELIGGCVAMGDLEIQTGQSKIFYTIPKGD
jgi:hypothetical protein